MDQQAYRRLISGQTEGLAAAVLRILLLILSLIYCSVIRLRNFLYARGAFKTYRSDVPVISVGNITAGGTGKTPLVIWVCRLLEERGISTAILTRGYKSAQRSKDPVPGCGDEPAVLAESCPKAKVIVNPDRVAGANQAVSEFAAQALVMDDGFQHRRLHRDLDIVTIDATEPFGFGSILPAGLLREPVSSLKRAGAAVITRSDQVSDEQLARLESKLNLTNPKMAIAKTTHTALYAKSADGKEIDLDQLACKKIFAFCGIGNPQAFFQTIKQNNAILVGSKIYDDHYRYSDGDIAYIREQARKAGAEMILTTQKDFNKISHYTPKNGDITLAYLAVELKFTAGEDKIRQLIEAALAGKI